MAAINPDPRRENYNSSEEEKVAYSKEAPYQDAELVEPEYRDDIHHHLHRGLKSRQVAMIAIGGAIGTGLIIGT
jgi:amino acid transporter